MVACHAENNVPVSSEDEVIQGRANHWIRIERYWKAKLNVKARFLPVFCQQCGNARDRSAGYASYQHRENINIQVYNRCVGTRYCGNNCRTGCASSTTGRRASTSRWSSN